MYSHKNWTPEQISKMNEETFLVEEDHSDIEQMRKKLDVIEKALQTRLEVHRSR